MNTMRANGAGADVERLATLGELVDPGPCPDMRPSVISRRMSDIESEPIDWLWEKRIATKLTVLAGNPGLGKSQLSNAFVATVTTGRRWPDATPCQQGSVILICGEDDAADTIKPRLEAAGADTTKVHIIDAVPDAEGRPRTWGLEEDVPALERLVSEIGDVRLIVIDPITAYIGRKDGHSTSDVRGLLAPLMELTSRHRVAILAVSHLNKASQSEAMTRVTGSLAYVAAARAAYVVGPHPEDEDVRCLAPLKNNLGDDRTGFGYRVVGERTAAGIETSRIEWVGGAFEVTASDVLAAKRSLDEPDPESAKGRAAAFLMETLGGGPIRSTDIRRLANEAGIADRTLDRAKDALHVRSERVEGVGWCWVPPSWRPEREAERREDRQPPPPLALGDLDAGDEDETRAAASAVEPMPIDTDELLL